MPRRLRERFFVRGLRGKVRGLPVCLSLALCLLAGCDGPSPSDPPHLVLVVIDSLRADHLGAFGYHRNTSPHIDRIASEGWIFERAFSVSSWTRPSVASLFTSRHPSKHGAVSSNRKMDPRLTTLAESLRSAGYRTVGASGNFVHVGPVAGITRGFEEWFSRPVAMAEPGHTVLWTQTRRDGTVSYQRAPTGSELNETVLAMIPEPLQGPLFLYVHYMEPHAPYAPLDVVRAEQLGVDLVDWPGAATTDDLLAIVKGERKADERERQRLMALYDGEIARVDAAIGELLEELAARGVLKRSVLLITSDHGESFGEHGDWFHGFNLHLESLQIPLVLRDFRDDRARGSRTEAVDLLDVPTTLLALAGVEPAPGMRGRSLLEPRAVEERALVAELHRDALFAARARARTQRLALTRWPWRVILSTTGDDLLYRVDRDSKELEPIPTETDPAGITTAARNTLRFLSHEAAGSGEIAIDAQLREQLRALGYAD